VAKLKENLSLVTHATASKNFIKIRRQLFWSYLADTQTQKGKVITSLANVKRFEKVELKFNYV